VVETLGEEEGSGCIKHISRDPCLLVGHKSEERSNEKRYILLSISRRAPAFDDLTDAAAPASASAAVTAKSYFIFARLFIRNNNVIYRGVSCHAEMVHYCVPRKNHAYTSGEEEEAGFSSSLSFGILMRL
jgi:hypothetical protein